MLTHTGMLTSFAQGMQLTVAMLAYQQVVLSDLQQALLFQLLLSSTGSSPHLHH